MLPIHFAPLQGYTEAPYRRIHQEVCGGIQSYYTPFIRLEHGNIRHKDLREALPAHNEGVPVVPQVIAANAAEFVPLADKLLSIGHKRIDINMGCPFPLQTRLGRGSGLLPHAEQVAEILQEAQRLTHEQGAQFSVKMRLGQDAPTEWEPLLPLLNATPLVHITLHARYGREQYKGALHLDQFEAFYEQSPHPVIYNGLLTSVQEMQEVEQRYPRLGGLMIGRGLLARPTLVCSRPPGHPSRMPPQGARDAPPSPRPLPTGYRRWRVAARHEDESLLGVPRHTRSHRPHLHAQGPQEDSQEWQYAQLSGGGGQCLSDRISPQPA